jgi:hypothetical protein
MAKPSKILLQITDLSEWRIRRDLHRIFTNQRQSLPIHPTIQYGGIPSDVLTEWQNQFTEWFVLRQDLWRKIWDKSIKRMSRKLTIEEAFIDFIEIRSAAIGLELAAVNAKTIDTVLRLRAIGSVKNLTKGLKQAIGLNPIQFGAFVKQAAKIDKIYSKEKAQLLKDRLYQKKLNYRAQLIARTEISNAVNQSQIADIKSRIVEGDLPEQMEKRWSAIGDERTSDGCLENEAEGWIPIDDVFPSGDTEPPRFPGCRCGLQFRARKAA